MKRRNHHVSVTATAAISSLVLSSFLMTMTECFSPLTVVSHGKMRTSVPIFTPSTISTATCTTSSTITTSPAMIVLHMIGGGGNFFRPPRQRNEDNESDKDKEEEDEIEEEDGDDDYDQEEDVYRQAAASEFMDTTQTNKNNSKNRLSLTSSSSLAEVDRTSIDWGGEYGKLRERITDTQSGKMGPARALFRIMSAETPNEAIMGFVTSADPEVVATMSSAVSTLLGGLSSPRTGMETIIKANGEKLGSLCFQLQMTGYMFRNAEYVLAIKELMDIDGEATLAEYKEAFNKLDTDNSGYIEASEVEALLSDVYDGDDGAPDYEVEAFLNFFDSNKDGKISWDEFERGLGAYVSNRASKKMNSKDNIKVDSAPKPTGLSLPGAYDDIEYEDEDDDEKESEMDLGEATISGKIEVDLTDGTTIEIEAKEYVKELKQEAEKLKEALRREKGLPPESNTNSPSPNTKSNKNADSTNFLNMPSPPQSQQQEGRTGSMGIAGYIASLQGDVQSLTEGISPEIVEAMKLLINYVLDGGPGGRGKLRQSDDQLEMEIPGSALQQLALWQLVLGYKLREAEATGDYRQMLDD
eukprot:CAMPEP_0184858614 /NCGR_PEP_ID=MMETSP0580-20130426/3684_1 /TAXON_ID=1118495 /ORGANISM="Dactyliosolen fragilissimus" /LENGTH=582 /DNA_ID=CAMNT_0027354853 /DNA_START=278 /DNA_END=2026 /DNA_ORIENTATION=-